MFVPTSFVAALVMTALSTFFWGSFANMFKLFKNYRFELYYWDYALGIFLTAVVLAFTMGSVGGGETAFLANLHSADPMNMVYAGIGGFIFNIANVLLIAGIEIAGLAVAFPIAIGIALVEGVILSYAIQPKGNPLLLGAGVLMAVIAVVLIGKAYSELKGGGQKSSRKGVIICIVSGLLMGLFAPFITRAMTAANPLTPYSVSVFFTLGALICCFFFNIYLMKRPLVGEPITFAGYRSAPASYHVYGMLGGMFWSIGTVFNFVAASLVGVAISYAIGQASPMVAAAWGVFVWHEFKGSNARAKKYLAGMFACYFLALLLIASAY
jgi:glucose uptake protein